MKINNERFTVRTVGVAEHYGFSTVGKFKAFLKSMNPNSKLFGAGGVYAGRATTFLKEIDKFEADRKPKKTLAEACQDQERREMIKPEVKYHWIRS